MTQIDVSLTSYLQWTAPSSSDEAYTINFNFEELDLFDLATFNAYLLAVESFASKYPCSQKVTMASLDGSFDFIRRDTEKFEEAQAEMKLPADLVCAILFSDYLHRLASALLEEAVPTILIRSNSSKSQAEMIWLFCKRRFEHFQLEFIDNPLPISGGASKILSLPQDESCHLINLEEQLDANPDCICIPEEYLNEHWDEAAEIIYDPETIGELGRRMLLGFEAAGGAIKKAR